MNIINKIVKRNLTIPDVISYVYVSSQRWFSGFVGTLFFRMKAVMFGITVKGGVRCYGPTDIMRTPESKIIIGKNVSVVSSSKRCTAGAIYAPTKLRTWSKTSKIILEDNVGLNGTSITARSKTVKIGSGTMVAPNVTIMDSDFHALWPPDNRAINPAIENDADVLIGKNVWIGNQCLIKKGVTIGDNSIIAAGSVVASNIPANVLAGGVPAKVIRKLP